MKSYRALTLLAGLAAVCAPGQTQTPVFSTGQAARLVIGQRRFTTADYGTTDSLLGSPSGIAYSNGILWVSDSNRLGATPDNNRILRFSDVATYPSLTQDPTVVGSTCGVCRGDASLVLGQPDFISSNLPQTPNAQGTTLRNPTGVATDGKILVVADTDNNRVLIWTTLPQVNGQPANIVIGQPDFASNGTSVPPTAKSLRGPIGVWLAAGKLYVADTQNNRVLIYNQVPTANNAAADVVIGQPNFTSLVQPDLSQQVAKPSASNMQTPVSVTTDGQRMFVADLAQNRILIWNTIPTKNGAPADIALGQINLTTAISNNSYTIVNTAAVDANNNPTDVTPVMCQSNAAYAASIGQSGATAADPTTGTTLYPPRCAATLSLPRFALSDGTRLFVADGGNDRVLVYNTMPTQSGQAPDVILGEPDEFSDNTGQNPDGADAFQTPVSLAYDGQNLYVGDTYNRRVVVYTAALPLIPLGSNGVLNAASLSIYAIGSVQLGGGIQTKDVVTVTIDGTAYAYSVVASDTLTTVTDNLVKLIDKAPGDPHVIASANDVTATLVLTARVTGTPGGKITLTAAVSTTSSAAAQIAATASGATLNIYLQNATQIAPGTLIEVSGTNLCDSVAVGSTASGYLPGTLAGCELFIDGQRAPLLYVSPTQINAQMPLEYIDRTAVSLYGRNTHANGTITVTTPIGVTIVQQNPGIFAQYGPSPRPGIVYHGSSSAISTLSIDGSIHAGDVAALTIGSNTYSYTVLATDTLVSVRDALVNLIDSAPDPNVYAGAANEFQRIILVALKPGPAGEGIAISQSITGTGAALVITVLNTPTCCDNTQGALVTSDNPAVPGEIVYVYATGLGPTNPSDQNTGQVFAGGEMNPAATPVDSILVDGSSANILSASLVPGLVGVYYVQFQLGAGLSTDLLAQLTIAQQAFVSNVVVFPIVAPPTASAIGKTPSLRIGTSTSAGR